MPIYEAEGFSPPAPIALVRLRDPLNGTVLPDIPLLMDTGADVTLLPGSAIRRLGVIPESGQYELNG